MMGLRRSLLVVPAVIVLATPLYARSTPRMAGVPFFVWFQFVMVVIGMAFTLLVFRLDSRAERSDGEGRSTPGDPGA